MLDAPITSGYEPQTPAIHIEPQFDIGDIVSVSFINRDSLIGTIVGCDNNTYDVYFEHIGTYSYPVNRLTLLSKRFSN